MPAIRTNFCAVHGDYDGADMPGEWRQRSCATARRRGHGHRWRRKARMRSGGAVAARNATWEVKALT